MKIKKKENMIKNSIFKASKTSDNTWIEGNLMYTFTDTPHIVKTFDHILGVIETEEVVESTICQYLGTDKNGKKVFEKDIVKLRTEPRLATGYYQTDDRYTYDEYLGIIRRNLSGNGFSMVCYNGKKKGKKYDSINFSLSNIEVVGNYFDDINKYPYLNSLNLF